MNMKLKNSAFIAVLLGMLMPVLQAGDKAKTAGAQQKTPEKAAHAPAHFFQDVAALFESGQISAYERKLIFERERDRQLQQMDALLEAEFSPKKPAAIAH
jgi:hypothetical protein